MTPIQEAQRSKIQASKRQASICKWVIKRFEKEAFHDLPRGANESIFHYFIRSLTGTKKFRSQSRSRLTTPAKMGNAWFHPLTAQKREDGTYDPSPFTLMLGTSSKSSYVAQQYEAKYTGNKPVLVVCTDDGKLTMENDKIFNTGNHPIEMFVPMLHLRDAGFTFDVATASGRPVVLEMWA